MNIILWNFASAPWQRVHHSPTPKVVLEKRSPLLKPASFFRKLKRATPAETEEPWSSCPSTPSQTITCPVETFESAPQGAICARHFGIDNECHSRIDADKEDYSTQEAVLQHVSDANKYIKLGLAARGEQEYNSALVFFYKAVSGHRKVVPKAFEGSDKPPFAIQMGNLYTHL